MVEISRDGRRLYLTNSLYSVGRRGLPRSFAVDHRRMHKRATGQCGDASPELMNS